MIQAIMAAIAAAQALKADKEAGVMNTVNSANTAASPWTNAKANVNFSKAPDILSQGVGTYYAMDREMERDKLAKEGRTGAARAMGGTDLNPWSFGQLSMPGGAYNMFGSRE